MKINTMWNKVFGFRKKLNGKNLLTHSDFRSLLQHLPILQKASMVGWNGV